MQNTRFIDGRQIAFLKRQNLKQKIIQLKDLYHTVPCLHVILVGDHPPSQVYVRNKQAACQVVGIESYIHKLPAHITQEEILDLITSLNTDPQVNGILLQLPLPAHLSAQTLLTHLNPDKDVDGLHPINLGQLLMGRPILTPCTPQGCMEIIRSVYPHIQGKHAVVVGRSVLVGKPMAMLLVNANVTVTLAHSYTQNLKDLCRQADILITAVGSPHFFNGDYIKSGALIIDVGINRKVVDGEESLVGDVNTSLAQNIAGHITPVPGGVGPMTVSCLLSNTVQAMEHQLKSRS